MKNSQVIQEFYFFITRWRSRQCWPLLLFYVPMYFLIPWLVIKYRSWQILWAINPALENGGWWGERKSSIDQLLRPLVPQQSLRSLCFSSSLNASQIRSELLKAGLTFPMVLKPNQGKQGRGVLQINDMNQLEHELQRSKQNEIYLQEFCALAVEAGLLVYRLPGQPGIQIFSLTLKNFPKVVGDGKQNLLELCLRDKSLRLWIKVVRKVNPLLDWAEVLPSGQEKFLTWLGNHTKGCLYQDASHSIRREDLGIVTRLFESIPGLDFVRFDLKFENLEKFQAGEFKIIEMNGAGAESINIHDPRYSLSEAYRILLRQWRLLFQIGEARQGKSSQHFNSGL